MLRCKWLLQGIDILTYVVPFGLVNSGKRFPNLQMLAGLVELLISTLAYIVWLCLLGIIFPSFTCHILLRRWPWIATVGTM